MFLLFGSLLPDIDCKTSMLGRFNPFVRLMRHRGRCHTLGGCILLSLPFALGGWKMSSLVFYGCLLHIISDKIYSWSRGR